LNDCHNHKFDFAVILSPRCARSVRLQQPLRNDQVLCMVVMDQYKLL